MPAARVAQLQGDICHPERSEGSPHFNWEILRAKSALRMTNRTSVTLTKYQAEITGAE